MGQNRVIPWYYWVLVPGLMVIAVVAVVHLPRPPTGEQGRQFAKELGCTERNKFVTDNHGNRLPDELIFECNRVLVNEFYMRFLLERNKDEKWKPIINGLRRR